MSPKRGKKDRLGPNPLDASVHPVLDQAPYAALLSAVAADGPGRMEATRALARALGAEDMILFLRDPDLAVLLPAPGFPQTLPDGRTWRTFLEGCAGSGASEWCTERLRAPGREEPVETTGIASGRDTVLVLLGGVLKRDAVATVAGFLPLLVSALAGERAARVADGNTRVARDAAARAEALAGSLDSARSALTLALNEVRESRSLLQDQAAALQSANEELEAQSEELQVINEELEQQTNELVRQIGVAETATEAMELARTEAVRARGAAEDANRSKSEFLASMSHELRTPLNAIGGYVQLIELGVHGPVTPPQLEALERVRRNQQHLLSLINDVLNFAKIEAGRVEYKSEKLRLEEVVADVTSMIETQFRAKGLTFEMSIAPEIAVCADADKLRQVMLNLLSNAVKFTESGGRVTVDAITDDEAERKIAVLRIADTGCGIPLDKQELVFDPFVQVHRDLTRQHEGAGLGLAISRDLARGMGGDLSMRNNEGEGSTFLLTLPRA